MKIEVLGTERRRRWSLQDKLQIVEETLQHADDLEHLHPLVLINVIELRRRVQRPVRVRQVRPSAVDASM